MTVVPSLSLSHDYSWDAHHPRKTMLNYGYISRTSSIHFGITKTGPPDAGTTQRDPAIVHLGMMESINKPSSQTPHCFIFQKATRTLAERMNERFNAGGNYMC